MRDRVSLAAALAEAAADALAPQTLDQSNHVEGLPPPPSPPPNTVAGSFMLPDTNGVMAPASLLIHNDAEWLLGGDGDGGGGGGGGGIDASNLRLVHPSVPGFAAEILGARSLRNLYAVDKQSTDRLPCPSAQTLRRLLPAYGDAAHALMDIAEIADTVGASGMEVRLDLRKYPSRSLLLPQLAGFQAGGDGVHSFVYLLDLRPSSEVNTWFIQTEPDSTRQR